MKEKDIPKLKKLKNLGVVDFEKPLFEDFRPKNIPKKTNISIKLID